jgi:hypothetical protein
MTPVEHAARAGQRRTVTIPRRIGWALAAVALAAGCGGTSQPLVTVFTPSGGSVSVRPQCWAPEGAVSEQDCTISAEEVGRLQAAAGETIGISVPPQLAEEGWVPAIGSERLTPQHIDGSYYRFALGEPDLQTGSVELRVFAVQGEEETTRGLWLFEIVRST